MPTFRGGIAVIGLLLLFIGTGCDRKPCENNDCVNSSCFEGECICDAGFEGKNCQVQSRDRLLGAWLVGDICRPAAEVYELNILPGEAKNEIVFDNLGKTGILVTGEVNKFEIIISAQSFKQGSISGAGGIDQAARIISIEYEVDDGNGNVDFCQAAFHVL
ncbi:MAG TPA: hypothetical protein ENJ82_07820 [Bacteroidetes bacterium]|nr:hypothetical protein [Bacteroidota bacterium]